MTRMWLTLANIIVIIDTFMPLNLFARDRFTSFAEIRNQQQGDRNQS